MGYGTPPVFHLTEKTAATVFERAGFPEVTTSEIIGHRKQTITYRLYSGGTSVEQRQEATVEFERLMLEKEAGELPSSGDK